MGMPYVDAEELARRLPIVDAIDALEAAFRDGDPDAGPTRSHVETATGSLLLMPATGPAGVGVKLVTVTPSNPSRGVPLIHALYVLFDAATQAPRMLVDGSALTALRTAAVSGLATRHLANDDAHRLLMFGAGVQARAHLEAIAAVRPVSSLVVVGRGRAAVDRLVALAGSRGIEARAGDPGDVAEADVVCTCTTATEPLFDGAAIAGGTHVNAVGAFQPHTRELDTETVRRARVVVETRAAAMAEAGDLLVPIGEGAIAADHIVADLREVVRGATVRMARDDVTVFESVGLAFEDLAVAGALAASP